MPKDEQTTYYDVRDRYFNDSHFNALVDAIFGFATHYKYTPGELRDAAFMAAMKFEEIHIRGTAKRDQAMAYLDDIERYLTPRERLGIKAPEDIFTALKLITERKSGRDTRAFPKDHHSPAGEQCSMCGRMDNH